MIRALNWLADAARCVWALLYWNTLKTFYVLRGRRGRCPCQNPSDIGSAGGVRCDASAGLNKRLRFHRVCPLLVTGPDGRGAFCSVPASQVRPFWGRALLFFAGMAVAFYVGGATVVFVGLRVTGVDTLSWRQVAWPGAWDEVAHVRSVFFFKKAMIACARRDYREAYRSIETALAIDPRNYDARLLMAQYAEFAGDFMTADDFFEQIRRDFPGAAMRTAITCHDTLLAVGRYDVLAKFCLRMRGLDAANRSNWVGSLLLAMHLGRLGPDFMAGSEDALSRFTPDERRMVQGEALLAGGDKGAAWASLRMTFNPPVSVNDVMQQIQWFLRAGAPADAEVAWSVNVRGLDDFDRRLARCWVDQGLGYFSLAELEFAALADASLNQQAIDKLVATLVMQPDRNSFMHLHRRVVAGPGVVTCETVDEMWLAAVVCGAGAESDYWAKKARDLFGVVYPAIKGVDFNSLDASKVGTVPFLVGGASYGRNTINALYWRVDPPVISKTVAKPW